MDRQEYLVIHSGDEDGGHCGKNQFFPQSLLTFITHINHEIF